MTDTVTDEIKERIAIELESWPDDEADREYTRRINQIKAARARELKRINQ